MTHGDGTHGAEYPFDVVLRGYDRRQVAGLNKVINSAGRDPDISSRGNGAELVPAI